MKSSEKSVLQVVLESDVERSQLILKQAVLLEKQQTIDDPTAQQAVMNELNEIYERMAVIGVESAESRAASILSGLQFSEAMQSGSTDSLSGGWRMRVGEEVIIFSPLCSLHVNNYDMYNNS